MRKIPLEKITEMGINIKGQQGSGFLDVKMFCDRAMTGGRRGAEKICVV